MFLNIYSFKSPRHWRTIDVQTATCRRRIIDAVAAILHRPPMYIVADQTMTSILQDPRYARYTAQQLRFPELDRFINERYCPLMLPGPLQIYQQTDTFPETLELQKS